MNPNPIDVNHFRPEALVSLEAATDPLLVFSCRTLGIFAWSVVEPATASGTRPENASSPSPFVPGEGSHYRRQT